MHKSNRLEQSIIKNWIFHLTTYIIVDKWQKAYADDISSILFICFVVWSRKIGKDLAFELWRRFYDGRRYLVIFFYHICFHLSQKIAQFISIWISCFGNGKQARKSLLKKYFYIGFLWNWEFVFKAQNENFTKYYYYCPPTMFWIKYLKNEKNVQNFLKKLVIIEVLSML